MVHTVIGTAANVHDVTQGHGLLHGEESVVFADAGYRGVDKREEATGVAWQVAMRAGQGRTPISGHQVPVWLYQGSLQRIGQEHGSAHHPVCPVQFVDGSKAIDGSIGMSATAMWANAPKQPEKAAISNPKERIFGEKMISVLLDEFLLLNSRCGGGCADLP